MFREKTNFLSHDYSTFFNLANVRINGKCVVARAEDEDAFFPVKSRPKRKA